MFFDPFSQGSARFPNVGAGAVDCVGKGIGI